MSKLLNYLFLMCLVVGLSVLVMIFGWGLQPRSWWWIIGGGVFGQTILRRLLDVVDKEGKE